MDDTRTHSRLPATGSVQRAQASPLHVSAAVAATAGEAPDPRIEMFQALAAIPMRRASVSGAAAPKPAARHVVGGARGSMRITPAMSASAAGTSVALADGTRITFGSVHAVVEPEFA
ncbi:MAG TPA: hypothetical protein VGG99_21745 [Acetobacteraceae bacterium]|jgi:hypothetical protein